LITSSPRGIRQRNEVAALSALHQFGRLSRADLARKLGLNRSSSGHIIAGLTSDGLVREVNEDRHARANTHAGRPGIMLELIPDAVFFIGVEIGVEHISIVEVDLAAKIISSKSEPFDGAAIDVADAVRRTVGTAFEAIPASRVDRCEGFGIATPAQMDRHGFVRLAPLLGWENVQLTSLMREALPVPVPVVAENDANAFAIGATYGRKERHPGVTLFLVMESGVGGGIVVDGRLFRGAHGLAGEVGHLRIGGLSGPDQTLEQIIGFESVMQAYRGVSRRPEPTFQAFLSDVRDRVPDAVTIAEEWARALAIGLIQSCRVVDADRVVLGGSVAALYPLMAARVGHYIQSMQEESFPMPDIVMKDDETVGPAFGVACMLHQRYLSLESQRFAEGAG